MSAPITTDLLLSLVVPGDEPLPVDAQLIYDAADPYAVTLDIRTAPDTTVTWSFARELLTAGVEAPAGVGDVRIVPVGHRDGRRVRIALSSPDGAAVLEAALSDMVEFLAATYAVVPTGCEAEHLDVDSVLTALLADSTD
jgi:hypothetical protein